MHFLTVLVCGYHPPFNYAGTWIKELLILLNCRILREIYTHLVLRS